MKWTDIKTRFQFAFRLLQVAGFVVIDPAVGMGMFIDLANEIKRKAGR